MELRIENGRYVERRHGGLETVSGAEELAQRIIMKLSCRRGSFLPLPDFGSRLHLLHGAKPSERHAAAQLYVAEALSGERELALWDMEITQESEHSISLSLLFEYRGGTVRIKTKV